MTADAEGLALGKALDQLFPLAVAVSGGVDSMSWPPSPIGAPLVQ